MARAQTATTLAIALGAFLGALAAMLEREARAPEPPLPSPAAPAPPTASTRPSPPQPADAGRETSPPPDTNEPTSWLPPVPTMDEKSAMLACARRDLVACLSAADALRAAGDTDEARLHEQLAAQRFAARCLERDPEACARLSELYRTGRGVAQSQEQHVALLERTREICRSRAHPACPPDTADAGG